MGPLGWPETVFIFFLALILFGPKKLPELGRTVGKALTEFRRASNELKSTLDREMKSLEQESEIKEFKEITNQYQSDTYSYDYSAYESTLRGLIWLRKRFHCYHPIHSKRFRTSGR